MKFDESVQLLHVDDDELDAEALRRAFRKNNIPNRLVHAANGVDALKLLRNAGSARPQILLIDINMPKMGGLELLKQIRQDAQLQSLQLYMLTTSNQPTDLKAAHDAHVAGYFVKPTSSIELTELVGHLHQVWLRKELPARA